MLEARIDRKAVNGRVLLEAFRLTLASHETVAITGPSGCGKTTLLRIVAGLEHAYDGCIEWHTTPRIGVVFQEPRLLPWRTVRQNLELVRPADPAPALLLLERLGLGDALDLYPSALSLGMARRVAIARALAIAPELLLLDEPFASLDAETAAQVRAVLHDAIRAQNCSVLLVTHDPADVASHADRVVTLRPVPANEPRN